MRTNISVVIPIFNAEKYITKAIGSVILQPEVAEIIIVDDGSSDGSLQICNRLATENRIIKIFQHEDRKNHGRSASRNLGIKKATSSLISFLDADDFYLPNRFKNDVEILKTQQDIDGVYNAISAHFYREPTTIEMDKLKLTTVRVRFAPQKLFENMGPIGHMGYFSGIGLTVRKSIFEKVGYFNELLEVAEDTELWLKMSLKTKLQSGIIDKPVSMRGIHEHNISFKNDDLYTVNNLIMYSSLLEWSYLNQISISRINLIWKKVWISRKLNKTTFVSDMKFWFNNIYKYPNLLLLSKVYKTFPLLSRFWCILKKKK